MNVKFQPRADQSLAGKIKLILGGVVIIVIAIITGILYQKNFDAVQTSLVKYLDGASHQCVAYVERYYQNMFGIRIANVGVAMNLAKKAPNYDLHFHENGSVVVPQPGDILVFGNKNTIGHVAIITGTLKDGVLIVEQNWKPAKITSNQGEILKAKYKDGEYVIEDRYYSKTSKGKFWIMGWVSRSEKNPGTFFNFTDKNDGRWLPEHNVKYNKDDNKDVWSVKVNGKDPRVLSPVFLDGLSVKKYKQIVFKAKADNNDDASEGVLYLRDEKNEWSEQIPFVVDYSSGDYQTFAIDLSELRSDFKITQIKLKLANDNDSQKEVWKFDWLRIGERQKDIL